MRVLHRNCMIQLRRLGLCHSDDLAMRIICGGTLVEVLETSDATLRRSVLLDSSTPRVRRILATKAALCLVVVPGNAPAKGYFYENKRAYF